MEAGAMSASFKDSTSLCQDFMKFQEVLKQQRKKDDIIVNLLNSSIPTIESLRKQVDVGATCKSIQKDLEHEYQVRDEEIKKCISYYAGEVERLRDAKAKADQADNLKEVRELGFAQRKLRVLQNELNIEEVIKERSQKALYERCREFV